MASLTRRDDVTPLASERLASSRCLLFLEVGLRALHDVRNLHRSDVASERSSVSGLGGGQRAVARSEVLEHDEVLDGAAVDDRDTRPRGLLRDEELVVRELAEADGGGRLDLVRSRRCRSPGPR